MFVSILPVPQWNALGHVLQLRSLVRESSDVPSEIQTRKPSNIPQNNKCWLCCLSENESKNALSILCGKQNLDFPFPCTASPESQLYLYKNMNIVRKVSGNAKNLVNIRVGKGRVLSATIVCRVSPSVAFGTEFILRSFIHQTTDLGKRPTLKKFTFAHTISLLRF